MPPTHDSSLPTVVVTGASTGIGAACALDLERQGWLVFAGVRKEADGKRLCGQASPRLRPLLLDVTDPGAIQSAVQTVGQAVGGAGLAGLVNNAGILVPGPLELVPLHEFRQQLEVNVIGLLAVTRAFLPLLRAGRGRIVNMSSISGKVAPPHLGAYAASKFAVEAISDTLRVELRRWGISVSIIEPDSVATPIWEKLQTAVDRRDPATPPEVRQLYEEDVLEARKASYRMGKTGMPVDRVVRAVRHALSAKRPRTRYPVGFRTRMACWAVRCLPDRLRDWFVAREMRLS